jgi:hypothetical protein
MILQHTESIYPCNSSNSKSCPFSALPEASNVKIIFYCLAQREAVFAPNVLGSRKNSVKFQISSKLNGNISTAKERPRKLVAISELSIFDDDP